MLRFYFTHFNAVNIPGTWKDIYFGELLFPWYSWGLETSHDSFDYSPVKRTVFDLSPADKFEEYIDLPTGEIDQRTAEQLGSFVGADGSSTPLVRVPFGNATYTNGLRVGNELQVEANRGDWMGSTELAKRQYPDTALPSTVQYSLTNETMENDPDLATVGYFSFAVAVFATPKYGYAAVPCVVPYNQLTDTIRLDYINDGTMDGATLYIYRAGVQKSAYPQLCPPWPSWVGWQLLDNHFRIDDTVAVSAGQGVKSTSAAWCNTAHIARVQTVGACLCPFIPRNNAIARMGSNWKYANYGVALLLDTSTHYYYKGYIKACSQLFVMGPDRSSESTSQFTLAITEEGGFVEDALLSPNGDHFTEVVRYATP